MALKQIHGDVEKLQYPLGARRVRRPQRAWWARTIRPGAGAGVARTIGKTLWTLTGFFPLRRVITLQDCAKQPFLASFLP